MHIEFWGARVNLQLNSQAYRFMALRNRDLSGLLFLHMLASLCSFTFCDRSDGSPYDRIEITGNLTFGCSFVGPCTPCSYSEKGNDETYHCSSTGYRQTYSCVELVSENMPAFQQTKSKRGSYESMGTLPSRAGRKVATGENSSMHVGDQILYIYVSCTPTKMDKELSALAFEGIMLGLLAVSAPIVYHRKLRHSSLSGMSRVPTSARF